MVLPACIAQRLDFVALSEYLYHWDNVDVVNFFSTSTLLSRPSHLHRSCKSYFLCHLLSQFSVSCFILPTDWRLDLQHCTRCSLAFSIFAANPQVSNDVLLKSISICEQAQTLLSKFVLLPRSNFTNHVPQGRGPLATVENLPLMATRNIDPAGHSSGISYAMLCLSENPSSKQHVVLVGLIMSTCTILHSHT